MKLANDVQILKMFLPSCQDRRIEGANKEPFIDKTICICEMAREMTGNETRQQLGHRNDDCSKQEMREVYVEQANFNKLKQVAIKEEADEDDEEANRRTSILQMETNHIARDTFSTTISLKVNCKIMETIETNTRK